jgi:membrane protein DedA with SNARE-associated domain
VTIESMLTTYGYGALFIGTLIEGETFLLSASVLAVMGYLEWPPLLASAFAGAYLGDQVCFHFGRAGRGLPFRPSPVWQRRLRSAGRLMDRHRFKILLGYRFLYGLRSAIPFAIGASGLPTLPFMALSGLGALAWVAVNCLAGALFTNFWR